MVRAAILLSAALAFGAGPAVAQEPVHGPCLSRLQSTSDLINAFTARGWAPPAEDQLPDVYAQLGQNWLVLLQLRHSPRTTEERAVLIEQGKAFAEESLSAPHSAVLVRGSEAVAILFDLSRDTGVIDCIFAGPDFAEVGALPEPGDEFSARLPVRFDSQRITLPWTEWADVVLARYNDRLPAPAPENATEAILVRVVLRHALDEDRQ